MDALRASGKNHVKALLTVVAVLAVACMLCFAQPGVAEAKSGGMENANVKWNFKTSGNWGSFKQYFLGVGVKTVNYKVDYKRSYNEDDDTYTIKAKLTFCDRTWTPTQKQINRSLRLCSAKNTKYRGLHSLYFTVVDYETGKCLEKENTKGVEVSAGEWKYSNQKKYKSSRGGWFKLGTSKVTVTITYPADYDGLCIGVGGMTKSGLTKAAKTKMDMFTEGAKTYNNSGLTPDKSKAYACFKRIR